MNIILSSCFKKIAGVENQLKAWKKFIKGKKSKPDVQKFSFNFMSNILSLNRDLAQGKYKHGEYKPFWIFDPKPRKIHKAAVRDRLLHHAIYRILYPFFERIFICDSFSCRDKKGVHKAINRFRHFAIIVSKNNTKTCWVLKCDIKKFFPNINHLVLLKILKKYIRDHRTINLLKKIINSYHSDMKKDIGLPLGNLTSQLFVNIYMNEFDQFMKHKLKAKYYLRYTDDFVVCSQNRQYLKNILPKISEFLEDRLKLFLHPNKIEIKTLVSGVDYLGWVNFADHRVLRTNTRKRMFRKLRTGYSKESKISYLGLLKHGNTKKLIKRIQKFSSFDF
mgnify:CR=1 FL=1